MLPQQRNQAMLDSLAKHKVMYGHLDTIVAIAEVDSIKQAAQKFEAAIE